MYQIIIKANFQLQGYAYSFPVDEFFEKKKKFFCKFLLTQIAVDVFILKAMLIENKILKGVFHVNFVIFVLFPERLKRFFFFLLSLKFCKGWGRQSAKPT